MVHGVEVISGQRRDLGKRWKDFWVLKVRRRSSRQNHPIPPPRDEKLMLLSCPHRHYVSLDISAARLSGENKFYLYIVSAGLLQEHEYPFENTPAEINW